jgi:cytochrome c-type biogenesis protein CcmH
MHRRLAALSACLLSTTLFHGCRDEARPAPPPPAATAQGDDTLRPLSSRDGAMSSAPAPTDGASAAPGSLPPGHPPLTDGAAPPPVVHDGPSISGTIEAGAAYKTKISGGALFLIARNAKNQIVAVRRTEDVALPQKFQISGADAMTVGTSFEGALDVTARWSQRGDAMPAPGDVEGVARGVAVGATNVKIVLSTVRP